MIKYINEFYALYLDMAFYMVLGLIMIALMKMFMPKGLIVRLNKKKNIKSIILASALGVPIPLCSCGVLPAAIELDKNKADIGVTTAFLISTPQTGVNNIIATYGMMGPFMAIYRALAAFMSGIIGGMFMSLTHKKRSRPLAESLSIDTHCTHKGCEAGDEWQVNKGPVLADCAEGCGNHAHEEKYGNKYISSIKYAFFEFIDDIGLPFIIGVAVAALISVLIPDNFIELVGINSRIVMMLVMIIIGLPMYICSTSSIPIAIALIMKGISPGAAFVFLFVGPVTNAASVIMLSKTIGKRETVSYIFSVIVLALLSGLLLDGIIDTFNVSLKLTTNFESESMRILTTIASFFLALLIAYSIIKKVIKRIKRRSLSA